MKTCPFCKAKIEKNARFCIYCMSSLEAKQVIETRRAKNKLWLYIIATVFAFAFIPFFFFFLSKETPDEMPSGTIIDIKPELDDNKGKQNDLKGDQSIKEPIVSSDDTPKHTPSLDEQPKDNSLAEQPTVETQQDPSVETSTTTYQYRDAKYGDDFSVHTDLSNSVVVTGVTTPSANGEYIIPERLGGKKVIAIMGLAFSDNQIKSTVKKVFVPATVKTIWGNAFANCYNLTDIYFCGKNIYVENNAFVASAYRTGTMTIHCAYDCSDRNLRYYRNSASMYDALYEEWNE